MTIEEYIEVTKQGLDDFYKTWIEGGTKDPDNYPHSLNEEEWEAQELAFRGLSR